MKGIKIILFLCVCISGESQSVTIPEFKFSKLHQSGIFTDKNVPSGKKSLFVFFDITCPHCQDVIKTFNKNVTQLKDVSSYLITLDSELEALKFLSKYGNDLYKKKNVTVLLDSYGQFITRFRPLKYPSMFLYSETKRLELYSDEPKDVSMFLVLIRKRGI